MYRYLALAIVLIAATAFGLLWRSRSGRLRDVRDAGAGGAGAGGAGAGGAGAGAGGRAGVDEAAGVTAVLAGLGVDPQAAPVTLVQFSSAFCAPCRATRRVLDEVVGMLPQVRYLEVDAERHLDAVRALDIRRTPTVLVIDGAGRIVQRASGQPRKPDVIAAVAPYLP